MIALLALAAYAQDGDTFDAHGFVAAQGGGEPLDPIAVWRAGALPKGTWAAQGLFEYADSPLIYVSTAVDGTATRSIVLDDLMALNLGARVVPVDGIAIALSAPIYLSSRGADGPQGAAMGDLRVAVPVAAIAPAEGTDGLAVSVIPFLDLPTGATTRFLGAGGVGGGGLVAAGITAGAIAVDGNVGIDARPATEFENLNGGTRLITGLAVGYALSEVVGVHAEGVFRPTLVPNEVAWTDSPGEGIVSARARHDGGFGWTVGAAFPFTKGATAAAYRVFAGVGYAPGHTVVTVAAPDLDADGFGDDDDVCPSEPETANGYADLDGCPDALGQIVLLVVDEDGNPLPGAQIASGGATGTTGPDGRLALAEVTPGTAVAITAEREGFGRTAADLVAAEGLNEVKLALEPLAGAIRVTVKVAGGAPIDANVSLTPKRGLGTPTVRGEPIGADGEADFAVRPGTWTVLASAEGYGPQRQEIEVPRDAKVPTVVAFELKPSRAVVKGSEIKILDQVQFDFAADTIKADSFALLAEIASVLIDHPDIRKVEVQGHTDDKGDGAYNKALSQRRVDAVVKFLVAQGVAADRLVPVGYGEEKPIAPNTTERGRAANRRVQFLIVDPPPATPAPKPK